jgi:hypothetical protein
MAVVGHQAESLLGSVEAALSSFLVVLEHLLKYYYVAINELLSSGIITARIIHVLRLQREDKRILFGVTLLVTIEQLLCPTSPQPPQLHSVWEAEIPHNLTPLASRCRGVLVQHVQRFRRHWYLTGKFSLS